MMKTRKKTSKAHVNTENASDLLDKWFYLYMWLFWKVKNYFLSQETVQISQKLLALFISPRLVWRFPVYAAQHSQEINVHMFILGAFISFFFLLFFFF